MTEKNLKFLVVFFSKNKRLIITIAALAAVVAAVWLIVSVTNWLVASNQEETVPWTVICEDANWKGTATDNALPRYFVAGGITYDQEILVNGWGLSEEVLTPVDYMENLGIHLLFGDVVKITYGNHRLQVVVDEKDFGYKLITVSKGYLEEGDLQIVFLNTQGVPISYEEDYVYSIPLEYTLVETGDSQSKASTVFMEVLDTETLPVLTGMNPALLKQHSGSVLLYIEGGEIATMQRNGNTLRVYTEAKPVYQVVAVDTSLFNPGQNIIRLIDSADLSVKSQIIFMIPDK